jgi:hypothetical protein
VTKNWKKTMFYFAHAHFAVRSKGEKTKIKDVIKDFLPTCFFKTFQNLESRQISNGLPHYHDIMMMVLCDRYLKTK